MSDFSVLAINPHDKDASARFARSFRETGFAVLHDHAISRFDIDAMYTTWADFFASKSRFNYAVKPGDAAGYFAFGMENAKGSAHKDLKEFFHVYNHKPLPPEVEKITRKFYQQLVEIGEMLLNWLDKETPKEVGLSESLLHMVRGTRRNLLRVLHYPPLQKGVKPGQMRAAAHEDINLVTILVSGSEPGLQAQDVAGNWHDVPCQSGYIIVNSGDMLKMASKGYYPSTPHRVINPDHQENCSRYSMPLFMHPRPEVILDQQTAGAFLNQRLKEIGLK